MGMADFSLPAIPRWPSPDRAGDSKACSVRRCASCRLRTSKFGNRLASSGSGSSSDGRPASSCAQLGQRLIWRRAWLSTLRPWRTSRPRAAWAGTTKFSHVPSRRPGAVQQLRDTRCAARPRSVDRQPPFEGRDRPTSHGHAEPQFSLVQLADQLHACVEQPLAQRLRRAPSDCLRVLAEELEVLAVVEDGRRTPCPVPARTGPGTAACRARSSARTSSSSGPA